MMEQNPTVVPKTAPSGTPGPQRRRTDRRTPWLTILVSAAVLLMVGTVTADVVLTYSISNNTAANAASHYQFVNGGNYATAHDYGLITNTAGVNDVSTAISGIQDVNVEIYDVVEFDTSAAPTATTTAHVTSAASITTAVGGLANVVCAYAFISDAVPTAGTVGVTGAPAGCGAVVPTIGAIAAACTGAGSATGVEAINLMTGATVSGTPGTCNMVANPAATAIIEYVSYAIYVTGAVAAGALYTVGINVGAP